MLTIKRNRITILSAALICMVIAVTTCNTQDAATDPATGSAVTTTAADTIHIAAFGSRGPSSDTVGSVDVGHTSGQRVGTTGTPPVSNVTIHETWELLTSTGNCRSHKTGATSRDWSNIIMALRSDTWIRQGLTPTDFALVEIKFDSLGKDYPTAFFQWNHALDRFEVFEESDFNTVIAHSANGWT